MAVTTQHGAVTRATAGTTDILAAPGVGKRFHIRNIYVSIAAFGTSGLVSITDGTTTYFSWDASAQAAGQPAPVHFSDPMPLGDNKTLKLVTAGTCTAYAVAEAEVR
jgi:hypothetical protein